MDPYSSGEEMVTKTRKPYTITKQRERWTEEEHTKFLEALKLYGRAWQRIEEHIGSKTAVQIRSHAQKFFTKLEKEALVKGLPIGQAIDIEIPPPRPKRKPSNPYPRKTNAGTPTSQVGTKDANPSSDFSLHASKHMLDLEKEPSPEKQSGVDQLEIAKNSQSGDDFSEALSVFQEAPSASASSANKCPMSRMAPNNRCTFKEFVPVSKEVVNQDATNESYVTFEASGVQNIEKVDAKQSLAEILSCYPSKLGNSHSSHDKLVHGHKEDELSPSKNFGPLSSNDMQSVLNYPRHVPVHIVNESLQMSTQNVSPDISFKGSLYHHMGQVDEQANLFGNVAASSTIDHSSVSKSSIYQSFPTFHPPFTPMRNSDCQSFLHIPSTFSSLLASALLQNPAAHAAASFAATLWPFANMESSTGPPASNVGDSPARQITSVPSLEAIAAVTVTAATAWWAAHGWLPLCAPFNAAGYTCNAAPNIETAMENIEARATNNRRGDNTPDPALKDQQLDQTYTETLQEQHLASKTPPLSSSESAECENGRLSTGLSIVGPEQAVAVTQLHDLNKLKVRKLVDRSSCGSNTASSSEVETDALEKQEKDKEESNEPDTSHLASDPSNRRGRVCNNSNESWKEVSEGGRLAFQALFSREVLPQSFAPPNAHQKNNIEKDKQHTNEKEAASQFDLNSKACGTCSGHQLLENNLSLRSENNEGEGVLTKFKARRTGFKPYKRCSVEAKERGVACNINQNEAKAPKRMRLEGGVAG